eukprot:5621216-Pyramimonas_sp.AAC.1
MSIHGPPHILALLGSAGPHPHLSSLQYLVDVCVALSPELLDDTSSTFRAVRFARNVSPSYCQAPTTSRGGPHGHAL